MYILGTILIGFFVGLIARFIMPGKDPAGFIATTVLGVVGALVGTFAGQGLGLYTEGESAGLFMSVIGAFAVLFLFNRFRASAPPAQI